MPLSLTRDIPSISANMVRSLVESVRCHPLAPHTTCSTQSRPWHRRTNKEVCHCVSASLAWVHVGDLNRERNLLLAHDALKGCEQHPYLGYQMCSFQGYTVAELV